MWVCVSIFLSIYLSIYSCISVFNYIFIWITWMPYYNSKDALACIGEDREQILVKPMMSEINMVTSSNSSAKTFSLFFSCRAIDLGNIATSSSLDRRISCFSSFVLKRNISMVKKMLRMMMMMIMNWKITTYPLSRTPVLWSRLGPQDLSGPNNWAQYGVWT